MIIQTVCFAQRSSTYNIVHLFEGNKVEYPRGVSVEVCFIAYKSFFFELGFSISLILSCHTRPNY